MNNERLFTKSKDGISTYIDSLTNQTVLLSNIKVTSILDNGNKVLGILNTAQVPAGNTTINKTTVVAATAQHNSGHSTGAMIGAGLAGAALGVGASYLMNRDHDDDSATQDSDESSYASDDSIGTVSDDDEE
jgi:hypothetical protein